MTKKELLKRIEELESRIRTLEARQIQIVPLPYYEPPRWIPEQPSPFRGYEVTCSGRAS